MRSYDGATAAYFAGQRDIVARVLIWITARDRVTGAPDSIGLWTGDDQQVFSIGGVDRIYHGAGAVLSVPPMVYRAGLDVRMHSIALSPLAAPVVQAVRAYEPRLAPVEMHRALFDPASMQLVAEPHRIFRGWVDELKISTPEKGGEASVSISLASAARALTRAVPQMKSDATQQLRSGDRFRRWIAISGAVDVAWGEEREAK